MASVSKRTSPRTGVVTWRVQFRIDGKLTSQSFIDPVGAHEFGDMIDSMGAAAALKVLDARNRAGERVPTLREFTRTYLDPASGMLTGIEAGTRASYERIAERSFLNVLGHYPVDVIERADVGKWVAWQESQPSTRTPGETVAAKTVRNYHALLSGVFKAAVEAGLRPDNPAYKIRMSRGMTREAVFLSPAEFKTLLHFIPERYKGLVLFLAGTGCRWGEATAVTWGDLTLHTGVATVRIDKAWKKGPKGPVLGQPKSAKSRRTVSMHAALVAALGEPGPADRLLFPGAMSGGHLWIGRFRYTTWLPAIEKAMDPELCAAAGLVPLTRRPNIHDLRHTHASWMIAAGIPLPYIQSRLGHENITTTVGVYGHLVPDAHEKMATAVELTLANVVTPAALTEALPPVPALPAIASDADADDEDEDEYADEVEDDDEANENAA